MLDKILNTLEHVVVAVLSVNGCDHYSNYALYLVLHSNYRHRILSSGGDFMTSKNLLGWILTQYSFPDKAV